MGNEQSTKAAEKQQNHESPKKIELTVDTLSKAQRHKLQELCHDDEWYYSLGVINMLTTVMIAVRFPAHYWIWHTLRTSVYLPARYIRFKARNWHLYLLDWCYVVTYLTTFCTFLALVRYATGFTTALMEYNQDLIHAGFAMACGPLAWSVFVFRNSIVFHDLEHSTSVFIHLSPFVLFWCLRWGSGTPSIIETTWPTMFHVCDSMEDFQAADACMETWQGILWCDACSASPLSFVAPPTMLYLFVWAVPYYVIVLIWWRDWCQQTGRETLYSYFADTHPGAKTWCDENLGPIVGEKHAGPLGYMVAHFLSMTSFCSTSYLMWHSFFLHTLLMIVVLIKAVQNGSTFMFRVFAYRYAKHQLETHWDKIEKMD